MKRMILTAMVVGALAMILASTALAAPAAVTAQGYGPGNGMHTPGTGLGGDNAKAGGGLAAMGGMMGGRGGAPEWAGLPAEVEKLLGQTEAQVQAQRLAGQSLAQIAATKNVSKETLVSTIVAAKTAELSQLVAAGSLTQTQADLMIARMQAQVTVMVDRTTTGPANTGRGQGMGMRRSG